MRKPITISRPDMSRRSTVNRAKQAVAVRRLSLPSIPANTPVRRPDVVAPVAPMEGPYLDYGRWLTAEGGIVLIYKDLDLRLRHTMWQLFAWSVVTGVEAWLVLRHSPVHTLAVNIACLVAVASLNAFIVGTPVEIYRRVEIRPDCMILDGVDVFWSQFMECGWPQFRADAEGNQILSGIYGTRFVDFFVVRRFDENDRMPEVFASHLQNAMQQLWTQHL